MAIERVFWDDEPDGNVEHIAEHGLTVEDVEHILSVFHVETTSEESGLPLVLGYLEDGRLVAVVFEWVDEESVLPITAYEVAPES